MMKVKVSYSHNEKEVIMTQQLFLISDVSRQLNVPQHRIAYLFITRKLPEPQLRLGNRRVFTLSDVQRVAKALGQTEGK
jgi:hypothetical protein